ncbi:DUF4254 domain-containing protein [Chloroflexota bacterium]
MSQKIPNFNTLSTLLDRLSIENVKLAHFENAIEQGDLTSEQRTGLQAKINVQKQIIDALKKETAAFMKEAFLTGRYDYMKEERTFQ